ncbi:MAG: RNA 2',3'-cyclic phosphodiesterase [SAR324 cluster bacterium]|nr:RNA 2',3'-cyclic phosphodiesterase [SAR324 cluster bacterium]
MQIRSFIALPLPEETAVKFFEVAETFCNIEHFQQIRWLPPENCHLTLAFLGDVEEMRLDRLARNLGQNLADKPVGTLHFCEVSPFPFIARPKVIAALAEATEWLKNLQSSCFKAARKSGIELDRRRFVPHVTLARMNGRKRNTLGLPPLFFETQITFKEVVVYESILHPEGAEYQILEVFALKKS